MICAEKRIDKDKHPEDKPDFGYLH